MHLHTKPPFGTLVHQVRDRPPATERCPPLRFASLRIHDTFPIPKILAIFMTPPPPSPASENRDRARRSRSPAWSAHPPTRHAYPLLASLGFSSGPLFPISIFPFRASLHTLKPSSHSSRSKDSVSSQNSRECATPDTQRFGPQSLSTQRGQRCWRRRDE